MKRGHALIVAVAVAGATAVGVFAMVSVVSARAGSTSSIDEKVAHRTAQLNRYAASLQRALRARPPALPPLPDAPPPSTTTQLAAPARVTYRRSGTGVLSSDMSTEGDEREDSGWKHPDGVGAEREDGLGEVELDD